MSLLSHNIRPRYTVLCLLFVASSLTGIEVSLAQDSLSQVAQIEFQDQETGQELAIRWSPDEKAVTSDSTWVAFGTQEELRKRGYWLSKINSIDFDEREGLWKVKGKLNDRCTWGTVYTSMDTLDQSGEYSAYALEERIEQEISRAEDSGYLLTRVTVDSLWMQSTTGISTCRVNARLSIDQGPQIKVGGFAYPNLKHSSPEYVQRASGIRDSMVVTPQLLRDAQLRLEQTELFAEVKEPSVVRKDSVFMIRYDVTERNPNRFDVLVGYVPNTGQETGGTIVGNADIRVRNLIWEGSDARIQFERLRAQVTKFDLGLRRYWIAGLPVSAGSEVHFLQQDTTYQTRSIRFFAGYEVVPGATVSLTGRRELVASNDQATSSDITQQLNSPTSLDANAWYGGIQLNYNRVNNRLNPSSGFRLNLQVESGVKNITDARADADSIESRLTPSIIQLQVNFYQELWPRHVLAPSVHGFANLLDQFTENDLIRFGGARSLRGYREDQFRASRLGWADLEYRYQLEASSYAFLFGSMGYYERPRLVTEGDKQQVQQDWLSSYGLGFSYNTRLGQLKFSYAISPEDSFSNGKVHFGIVGSL